MRRGELMYSKEELKEILIKEYPNTSRAQKEELAQRLGYKNSDVLRQVAYKLGVSSRYQTPDLDGEIWMIHDEYPDFKISSHGRVKGVKRNNLISTRVHEGYYDCRIKNRNGDKKTPRIHQLVAQLFVENSCPETNNVVNHIDGNKLNNHFSNLEWCTVKENNNHALENIEFDYSNNRPSKHLTASEVIHICEKLENGYSISDIMGLSERYTRARVEKIRQRKTFNDISKNYKWE